MPIADLEALEQSTVVLCRPSGRTMTMRAYLFLYRDELKRRERYWAEYGQR